jgi:ubiquinone/menaquinone biosynthesis C-methylase UbiE
MQTDYTAVTETPGIMASKEQIARMYQRYHFALQLCHGKEVLEVACGAGQGLGYIASSAKRVVGGDIDESNLRFAREHYAGRSNIELHLLDAHDLPFPDDSFDVVILYEAIYYLAHPEVFLDECRRIVRSEGTLLICTVNKDWTDFNPSPHSTRYFSARELYQLLSERFTDVQLYGGFQATADSLRDRITSLIKRTAAALNLIPKTMKGKEKLKRIFFGRLVPLPAELKEGMAAYEAPVPIPHDCPNYQYKVLYAVAGTPQG